jgi:valyl-tRNA synthetase
VLKLLAPFMPFITEDIYQKVYMGKTEKAISIQVSEWPEFDAKKVDEKALKEGNTAQKVIEFVRQWKHNNKMALNAELSELVINTELGETAEDVKGAMKIKKISKGKGNAQILETDIAVEIRR